MTDRAYLKWPADKDGRDRGSWHVLAKVTDAGWILRCGRVLTTERSPATAHLPAGEKTCESCLAGSLRDDETPADDRVPE